MITRMHSDSLVERIFQRHSPDEKDRRTITDSVIKLQDKGFSDKDILSYMSCTEEVSPCLDEDIALRRMKEISKKYTGGEK